MRDEIQFDEHELVLRAGLSERDMPQGAVAPEKIVKTLREHFPERFEVAVVLQPLR